MNKNKEQERKRQWFLAHREASLERAREWKRKKREHQKALQELLTAKWAA